MCTPFLFQCCQVRTRTLPLIPPDAIRVYVRYLTLRGYYKPENDTPEFLSVLYHLPFLTSITFEAAPEGVTWFVVERCLQLPNLSALTFSQNSQWLVTLPAPDALRSLPRLPLTTLSYATLVWRELKERPYDDRFPHTHLLADEYAAEARGLAPLILAIRETVERLYIPLDASPVGEMCQCTWPNLTDLRLRGAYADSMLRSIISILLSRMPRLHSLSVELAQPPYHSRAPVFGTAVPVACERLQLCSLTVPYPDPEDAIFSFVGVDLVHLSLRDWPRAYSPLRGKVALRFVAPILSAFECLRLLTRMNTPLLESLEVVYKVDDADDDLLRHIATAYPRLSRLEIHHYRNSGDDDIVPYEHISQMLASMASRSLHSLRLNLDFKHLDPPLAHRMPLTYNPLIPPKRPTLYECASVITTITGIQHLDLLEHDGPNSRWEKFRLLNGECVYGDPPIGWRHLYVDRRRPYV
ncbi:hypothetical protein C2E23DRAFT_762086 [Lenzites betulinus]|nr:hypothetical protein C2E23DRAFT_762086 [Lenzites betulinus]